MVAAEDNRRHTMNASKEKEITLTLSLCPFELNTIPLKGSRLRAIGVLGNENTHT